MSIQQLSPQLANQIAAGEVVERPASVVKELVENSIDAGATRIEIDIEHGGAKLIRIRDNGCGIAAGELKLALMRHATSKISSLDDLQAITSLGFRGEALASISSVSRLTLTSCEQGQSQAWQTYAEGRDMQVTVKPAAHPQGTTLEVRDLFYNTPARRKFMRTEKTEFMHIDEVIRRIALVRFDITLMLQHNGKMLRQYRAVQPGDTRERRLEAICGSAFARQALAINWQHGELTLDGWLVPLAGSSAEVQYSYVNGRMIRDRLLTHAIRQACEQCQLADAQPGWVLFLSVEPQQVDVNVHPAKYEVRFHQSRLVHDFVCQGVLSALREYQSDQLVTGETATSTRPAAGKNSFQPPVTLCEAESPAYGTAMTSRSSARHSKESVSQDLTDKSLDRQTIAGNWGDHKQHNRESYQPREETLYRQLVENIASPASRSAPSAITATEPSPAVIPETESENHPQSFGRVLAILHSHFALLEHGGEIHLLNLSIAALQLHQAQLSVTGQCLAESQPLLIPLRLKISTHEQQQLSKAQAGLASMGIEILLDSGHLTLCALPLPLRQQNLHILIPELIGYLSQQTGFDPDATACWLAHWLTSRGQTWSIAQAITLLAQLERHCAFLLASPPASLIQPIDLQLIISALQNE